MSGGRQTERRTVPDPDTQRALDPILKGLNDLRRTVAGVHGAVQSVQGDIIKFVLLAAVEGNLSNGDIDLASAVIVKLRHPLGKRLRGWVVSDLRLPSGGTTGHIERVLTDGTTTADDTRDLWLRATGWTRTVTVRVLVF